MNGFRRKIGMLSAILSLLCVLPVSAAQDSTVVLETQTDGVEVVLTGLPQEDVSTLKVTFEIEVQQGELDAVGFLFANDIASEVQEYRYQKESGRLTVYLSGKEALYRGEELALGKVLLSANVEAKAEVRVVPDGAAYVNASMQEQTQRVNEAVAEWTKEMQSETGEGAEPETERSTESVTKPETEKNTEVQTQPETEKKNTEVQTQPETEGKAEKVNGLTGTGDFAPTNMYMILLVLSAGILAVAVVVAVKKKQ